MGTDSRLRLTADNMDCQFCNAAIFVDENAHQSDLASATEGGRFS